MFFSTFIGHYEVHLFRRWVHGGDETAAEDLARMFFDLQFLRKFGIPEVGGPTPERIPLPSPFDPTPTPVHPGEALATRLRIHEHLLSDLLGFAAGDPSPQPSLVALLGDGAFRLKAARHLHERLHAMADGVTAEIERLEQGYAGP